MSTFGPLDDDPSAPEVALHFDPERPWVLTDAGEYHSAAVHARKIGEHHGDVLIALQWPGRLNHSDERVTVRLLLAPEDADGLADVLRHTTRWLRARRLRYGGGKGGPQ